MKNYNKFWIVFSLIVVFAAGFIGGILFEKHLIDKKVEKRVKRRSSVRFPSLEMMAQELSLTPEQKEQIREIFKNNEERFKNLRKNIDDRLSSIRSQLKNEIKNVLTDEQVLKFEAMIEKYISQRKKEMEKRKKHPKIHRKDKGEKRSKKRSLSALPSLLLSPELFWFSPYSAPTKTISQNTKKRLLIKEILRLWS